MAPKTLAERILSDRLGREVRADEYIICPVDVTLLQDGTGPLAVRVFRELGKEALANRKRTVLAQLEQTKEVTISIQAKNDRANDSLHLIIRDPRGSTISYDA